MVAKPGRSSVLKKFTVLFVLLFVSAIGTACYSTNDWYQAMNENERARQGDPGGVEQVIRRRFAHDPETAVRVARCESGLNPWAENGQYKGIFQLGSYHYWRLAGPWSDPVANTDAARGLQGESGWSPWSCW